MHLYVIDRTRLETQPEVIITLPFFAERPCQATDLALTDSHDLCDNPGAPCWGKLPLDYSDGLPVNNHMTWTYFLM